jgi:hypothetical protein
MQNVMWLLGGGNGEQDATVPKSLEEGREDDVVVDGWRRRSATREVFMNSPNLKLWEGSTSGSFTDM